MKIAWVLGWAVPKQWFAHYAESLFPKDTHVFIEPGPDTWDQLEQESPFDALGGYSLGAQLLLENPARASRLAAKIGLFAPIFAFVDEAGLGGKVSRTQVRYLSKWLRRDRQAALADFYQRTRMDIPVAWSGEIPLTRLDWGLSHLESGAAKPPAPDGWKLYCGTADPLLNGECLATLDPAVILVPEGTHHPEMLLQAWIPELQK
ncbi:MAG TPA: hypothetical protein VGM64_05115 [Lacunisphaera sp.]|jgi:hypothetical protein